MSVSREILIGRLRRPHAAERENGKIQTKQVLMILPQEEDYLVEILGADLAQNAKKRKHDKHGDDEEMKNVPMTVSVDDFEQEQRSLKRQRIDIEAQSIDDRLQRSRSGLSQRDSQAALLNR